MTDNSKSRLDDAHTGDGVGTNDHDTASANETWEGEPPVDDFHAGEDMATVSEETEMAEGDSTAEGAPGKKVAGKKSMIVPIGAGVGGLLIAGAILYWQFGMTPVSAPIPVASIPPLSTEAPAATNPAAATPALSNDVAPTSALAPVADKPATTAPSPTEIVALPPKPEMPMAAPSLSPAAAASQEPSSAAVPPATPIAMVPPPIPATTPSLSPGSAKDVNADARLAALTMHVEELQKNLSQTSAQLTQVTAMLSDKNAATSPNGTAMDERLNKIEQKLEHMAGRAPRRATPAASDETVVISAPRKAHKAMTRTHKKTATKITSRGKKSPSKMVMLDDVAKEMGLTAGSNWVLRAATPNEAWVSTDSTSKDLRHVQIGDELSGIGTIKAIHQNGDSWVVEGSEGTIQ